jgi:LPS-assembly protein
MQWDPETNDIVRGKATLHFVNNPGEILNLGFLYRKNNLIRDALDSALISNTLDDATRSRFQTYRNTDSILRSNDIIQSDVSFRFPITNDWFAVGRWQYSFLYDKTQDAFFGFEKENCCWRFRIIGRQYINNINNVTGAPQSVATAQAHSQTGIFFQIEFKGLTGIGESLDDFFTQSIYGYRKPEQ